MFRVDQYRIIYVKHADTAAFNLWYNLIIQEDDYKLENLISLMKMGNN